MLSASCYKGGLAVQLLLCCMHTLAWVVLSCLLGWRGCWPAYSSDPHVPVLMLYSMLASTAATPLLALRLSMTMRTAQQVQHTDQDAAARSLQRQVFTAAPQHAASLCAAQR